MNTTEDIIIDVVYTWVDMTDLKWAKKYKKNTGKYPVSNRYQDYGELEFSIKLLLKHCDFINNIYIVTDDQVPKWYNPQKYSNIFIIDHSQILGSECHKPTFKSDSIESYLHCIPNLSEYYIYLNDDTFIGNYCTKYHFIDKKSNIPIARFKSVTLNDNMKQMALRGAVYPRAINLINAVNCIKRQYKKHYNRAPLHQGIILRKSMGELAWQLFSNELSKSVKYATRLPREHTISFINLSLLLGVVNGKMRSEVDRYSIKVYDNYSLANGGVQYNLNKILQIRPQQFCINDINNFTCKAFKQFITLYLTPLHI